MVIASMCAIAACSGPADSRRAVPSYDVFSGRLVQLTADQPLRNAEKYGVRPHVGERGTQRSAPNGGPPSASTKSKS